MNALVDTIKVDDDMIRSAKEMRDLSLKNPNLGLFNFGTYAELLICHHLNWKKCKSGIQVGFDAIDESGNQVQIKTKLGVHPLISRFKVEEKEFEYALLVMLDDKCEISSIYKATFEDIKCKMELKLKKRLKRDEEKGNTGKKRRINDIQLNIEDFIAISDTFVLAEINKDNESLQITDTLSLKTFK